MKKKIGIIIEVRTGSKRFPSKCLKKIINNKNVLEFLIYRIKKLKNLKKVIATTNLKQDDIIKKIADKIKINIYRGSSADLVSRVIECAKKNDIEHIIQLTADNPLIDLEVLKKMISIYKKNNYEFISNSIVRTFPIGTDVRIFSLKSLIKISNIQKKKREHTCYYYLKNIHKFRHFNLFASKSFNRPDVRLTIDYKNDLILIKKILQKMNKKEINLKNILYILDKYPSLNKINERNPKDIKVNF
jgi:spore coat polysaccharide biosynthesis protein SpsF